MRIKYYGPERFVIERIYANGRLFCEPCPRVEDAYEWRAGELFYVETVDYYAGTAVTYHSPGHLWLTPKETLAYARHQPAIGTAWTLDAKWCQVFTRRPTVMRQSDFWRAVYADTAVSPFTGPDPVAVYRLDEVTVEGTWDNYWKESWYFYQDPELGYVPVLSQGYRQLPGQALVPLWDARLLEVLR